MSERIDLDMLGPDDESRERVIASAMWQIRAEPSGPFEPTVVAIASLRRPAIMLTAASILAAILSGGGGIQPAVTLDVPEQWLAWESGRIEPPGVLEIMLTPGGPQ